MTLEELAVLRSETDLEGGMGKAWTWLGPLRTEKLGKQRKAIRFHSRNTQKGLESCLRQDTV